MLQNNDSFASKNQLKRNEIIKTIENDLINMYAINVVKDSTTNANKTVIDIMEDSEQDKELIITIGEEVIDGKTKSYITYKTLTYYGVQPVEENYKWVMEDCTLNKNVMVTSDSSNDIETIMITIEVYTENDANNNCSDCTNNVIDDITLGFSGYIGLNAQPSSLCIGYDC